MDEAPSARDFYARLFPSEQAGVGYQKAHFPDKFDANNPDEAAILEFSPRLSNDPLLEWCWSRVIELAPAEMKDRLGRCFVAKRRDWEPQAGALVFKGPKLFEGDLIEFNVGFSDATAQVATFFTLTRLAETRSIDNTFRQSLRLTNLVLTWRETGEIWVTDHGFTELPRNAVDLSVLGDLWALAHEAAHVLLGHTSKSDTGSNLLALVPPPLRRWEALTDFAQEYQADAFALLLLLGPAREDPTNGQAVFEAAWGSLLALSVLYLADPQPTIGDDDHPPTVDRLRYTCDLLDVLTNSSVVSMVSRDLAMTRELADALVEWVVREAAQSSDDPSEPDQHASS